MAGSKSAAPRAPQAGAAAAHASRPGASDIHARLQNAILEHRLLPGTKLGEDRLADIFAVSRARIRQVLTQLAHAQLVEIVPQRGAFVACPSPEQARDVFEARQVVEPAVVQRLIATLTPPKLAQLRRHVAAETAARLAGDQRAIIRLSGEFHVLLAELAGNSALARAMRDLCAVTCLIISLYNAPTRHSCRSDEHAELIDAIAQHDVAKAQQLVREHLAHIEQSLVLWPGEGGDDLESILRE